MEQVMWEEVLQFSFFLILSRVSRALAILSFSNCFRSVWCMISSIWRWTVPFFSCMTARSYRWISSLSLWWASRRRCLKYRIFLSSCLSFALYSAFSIFRFLILILASALFWLWMLFFVLDAELVFYCAVRHTCSVLTLFSSPYPTLVMHGNTMQCTCS